MAEQASRLPEDDRPDITPDLPGLRAQEEEGGAGSGLYNAGGDNSDTGIGGLANSEAIGSRGNGGLYNSSAKDGGSFSNILASVKKHKKGIAIGGGAGGGVVAIIIVALFALVPLKVEHIVSNLQSRYFATSENATGDVTDKMLGKYLVGSVLPSYKKCGTTVSKNCKVSIADGSNPVTQLYKSWANAKLENTLATKYNIEFKFDSASNSWRLKAPGTSSAGDDIGSNGSGFEQDFQKADRATMRQAIHDATKDETRWTQVMYRFKVGTLLEQKYGIKRCIVFCGTRDQFADKTSEKKNAAKILLAQRVIVPRTTTLGAVMECLTDPNCHPENTTSDLTTGETGGDPESDFERQNNTTIADLAAKYGSTDPADVDKMIGDYNTISEKGYSRYVLGTVLDKVGLGEFTDTIAERASVVGWVNTAATVISSLKDAGPKVKKLSYVTNAGAAVSAYTAYRSYADEVHTGHVDATEVGSFTNSLGPGNRGSTSDPEIGGTASAESSPLYQNIMGGDDTSDSTSLLDGVLPAKTYADGTTGTDENAQSSDYECAGGKKLEGLVCPEEKIGNGNATADSVTKAFSAAPLSYLGTAASAWHNTIGGIFSFVGDIFGSAISHIPGVTDLTGFVGKAIEPFYTYLTNQLIPNPFGTNMSGARQFDMMAAGANVAGNDACTQIGCKTVSTQTAAAIINQQQSEARQSFDSQPVFARMFSTSSQYSLVSRLALDMPSSLSSSVQSGFASILSSPIGTLTHSFGSIFSGQKASAAASTDSVDPFNIGSVAFPKDDIPDDPEAYWDSHNCGDTSPSGPIAQWQAAAASPDGTTGPVNPDTGMPEHTTTEPCLLIKNAVGDAGAIYNTDLLSPDEKATLSGGNTSSDGSSDAGSDDSGSAGTVSGNTQALAQKILDASKAGKITFQVVNPANTADKSDARSNIESLAAGKKSNTSTSCLGGGTKATNSTTDVDPKLLQFVVDLSVKTSFSLNEVTGGCHAATSNHYKGKAVDIGCPFTAVSTADAVGKPYGIFDGTGETCANNAHYHYSIGGS